MKLECIARQSRRPSGWFGEIVARLMALENAPINRSAVDRLAPASGEAILEVGCGHGRTLKKILALDVQFAAGIDPSDVMVRLAGRGLRREIRAGRSHVELGEAAHLPFEDLRFDAALAVHVLYFWPDPAVEFAEIHRVLRHEGRLLVGFRPRDEASTAALPASVYTLRSIEDVEASLLAAGFRSTQADLERSGSYSMGWVLARA